MPPRFARIQAIAAIALLLWGCGQGIAALADPTSRQRLAETLTWEAFLAGRTAGAINHIMAHALPADPWLRAAGGLFRWGLFRSGGPQVSVGCDGWLFLTEELRPWPGAEAAMATRAAALGRIATALREKGITLVVAITPDKARVNPERLCAARYSAQAGIRHAEATALLRQAGLAPVDWLTPLLDGKAAGPVHFRTDTHWSQHGAAIAATALAAATVSLPLARAEAFRTRAASAETEGPGDLLRLMSLDRLSDSWRPRADRLRLETTTPESEPTGGLLDETPAPAVALIGSSYSLNANFHGRLQEALNSTVVNFAEAGGGFAGSARTFFASPTWRDTPPRLVIWEILERALGQPIGAEEAAFLAGFR